MGNPMFKFEADKCRRLTQELRGRPEERVLRRIADEFDKLAQQSR